MVSLHTAALLIGSIESAMQQPIFPGKIVIWLLFMFSIVSWVMILSKLLQLSRFRKADARFGVRLRKSRTTLEVFEEGWFDEHSLQLLIYVAGARETAFQLLGSRNPSDQMTDRIREAGKLSQNQHGFLEGSFEAGYRNAEAKLSAGTEGLKFIGVGGILLGLIGMIWTLMRGFDGLQEGGNLGPVVGSALGFLAIALLVATPAFLAGISFAIHLKKRRFELAKFRDDIARLFERKFTVIEGAQSQPVEGSMQSETASSEIEPDEEIYEGESEGISNEEIGSLGAPPVRKRKYHSIREKLMRPPEGESTNELSMNPIAQQAASMRGKW